MLAMKPAPAMQSRQPLTATAWKTLFALPRHRRAAPPALARMPILSLLRESSIKLRDQPRYTARQQIAMASINKQ